MGVWIFSDPHAGARSNNNEFLDIVEEGYNKFIIPTIENNWTKEDIIICCGDVFDNRQSINLRVIDSTIKIYERLAKLGEIHILAGNHDIYKKDSTEITSLDILKWIPNITIWKEPGCIERFNSKLFLMPWRKNNREESDTLTNYQEQHKPEYAFMHGTFANTQYNKYVKIGETEGCSTNSTKGYKRVYSGHIHWSQKIKNINIVGCPYELSRGDADNKKGIYYLDTETGNETFFENLISPKHLKFKLEKYDKDVLDKIEKLMNNNFIDIHIANSALAQNASGFTKSFNKFKEVARNVEIHQYDDTIEESNESDETITDHATLIQSEIQKRLNAVDMKRAIKIIDDIIKEVQ